MQRVEILSTTTKSKKIEIKGGFYNEEDMKNELGYSPIFGSMHLAAHTVCSASVIWRVT